MECNIILLFLFVGYCPLFEFFLVPVELKLDLLYFLISPKNSNLDIIQSLIVFKHNFIIFFYFILEPSALSLGDLPHVVFCFCFFVFIIYQCLNLQKFLLHVLQVFL